MLSRTANELFWMARHIERAENTARLLDVTYRTSLLPYEGQAAGLSWAEPWAVPLIANGLLADFNDRNDEVTADSVLRFMMVDAENPSSIFSCLKSARESARAVRGAITSEMYEDLNSAWLEMRDQDAASIEETGIGEFLDRVKMRSHLFRGVTFGTMLRDEAYHFIRLGTHLERADNTARILDVKYHLLLPSAADVGGAVDYYQWSALLRSVSGFESYRKIYRDVITPRRVAELLILRADMPRSLRACAHLILEALENLCDGHTAEIKRLGGELDAKLRYARISDIFDYGLHEYLVDLIERITGLGEAIAQGFFSPVRLQPVD